MSYSSYLSRTKYVIYKQKCGKYNRDTKEQTGLKLGQKGMATESIQQLKMKLLYCASSSGRIADSTATTHCSPVKNKQQRIHPKVRPFTAQRNSKNKKGFQTLQASVSVLNVNVRGSTIRKKTE